MQRSNRPKKTSFATVIVVLASLVAAGASVGGLYIQSQRHRVEVVVPWKVPTPEEKAEHVRQFKESMAELS